MNEFLLVEASFLFILTMKYYVNVRLDNHIWWTKVRGQTRELVYLHL